MQTRNILIHTANIAGIFPFTINAIKNANIALPKTTILSLFMLLNGLFSTLVPIFIIALPIPIIILPLNNSFQNKDNSPDLLVMYCDNNPSINAVYVSGLFPTIHIPAIININPAKTAAKKIISLFHIFIIELLSSIVPQTPALTMRFRHFHL